MSRTTVFYFEDEDGTGRIARDKKNRGTWVDGSYEVEVVHDYLVIERYQDGEWVETQNLGDYVDPSNLNVPKP